MVACAKEVATCLTQCLLYYNNYIDCENNFLKDILYMLGEIVMPKKYKINADNRVLCKNLA